MTSRVLLIGVLTLSAASAKKAEPVLEWKTGIFWASPDLCNEISPFYKETFLIVGDNLLYHVAHTPIRRKPNLTELTAVKFAMIQGDFYLQDDDGRVFKLSLVMKEPLDPASEERLKSRKRPCQP
jgi:hypothetical protein